MFREPWMLWLYFVTAEPFLDVSIRNTASSSCGWKRGRAASYGHLKHQSNMSSSPRPHIVFILSHIGFCQILNHRNVWIVWTWLHIYGVNISLYEARHCTFAFTTCHVLLLKCILSLWIRNTFTITWSDNSKGGGSSNSRLFFRTI